MKKYILIIAALAATVSCTKNFLDKNTNHENATDEMMAWDGLSTGSAFSQMTKNVLPSYQGNGQNGQEDYGSSCYQVIEDLAGNLFCGYTGNVQANFRANNVYNITFSKWYESMFNDAYTRVISPWEDLDAARGEFPEEAALGDILKVMTMHRVADTYGPIPYLQIGSGAITMAYDSQEVVYRKFFEELDSAIEVLTEFYQAQPGTRLLEDYDNVFYGNVGQWIKLANTLRMRLAMRVVYADNALAMEQAGKALANPVGLMAAAGDLAALHKPAAGAWEYPPYAIQHGYKDACIGATIEVYMNGYKDPRREKYFTKGSDGEYHGVRNGVNINANYAVSDLLSKINCTINDDLMWMHPSEAWFLKAEYWLRKGDMTQAQQCYEEGVRVSFDVTGASGADSYLKDASSTPGTYTDVVNGGNSYNNTLSNVTVAWSNADNFETKLERIITQKYIAIYPAGQEAWSEFRRTGYPKVIPYSVNQSNGAIDSNRQIRRLNWPSTEYRTNADNVNAAVRILNGESSLGRGDNGGSRVWWDKNTRF